MDSKVFYQWIEPGFASHFRTGVSLHSHTNHSQESLRFMLKLSEKLPLVRGLLNRKIARCRQNTGVEVNLERAYWTPPLTARMALDLEASQIADGLGICPLISISDHDNIEAPVLLRTAQAEADIPVSVEWSVVFSRVLFHLGIHNLPPSGARAIMAELAALTAAPDDERLKQLLAFLNSIPDVLTVLNHPLWDLDSNGAQIHRSALLHFLRRMGRFIHALELNGLRDWEENSAVRELASGWNLPVVGGGDRHGCEPNAVINLTRASTFGEFVDEIRIDRHSRVLMMSQYAEPMPLRVLQTIFDVTREYPNHAPGSQRWDERVFHPRPGGGFIPVSAMWHDKPARFIEQILAVLRLAERGPLRHALRYALQNERRMRFGLEMAPGATE
jgi:hypothetical protein